MNAKTNTSLTNHVDPSHNDYVGASLVTTNPIADTTIGVSGDYYWEDPSLFFKVTSTWYAIDPSGVTAI
jgi:hypothetical protein